MNTSALKSFAPAIRRQLIESIDRKLDYVLTADTADLRAASAQVGNLRRQADSDRQALIDRVAYTWFNRFAALRFLDARDWHPFRARIISPASEDETQPEVLKLTRSGALPSDLEPFTDTKRINDILDGRLPSSDPQGEVYRHLVLAACRYYHDLMPFLFEALDDETELLLPDDLLTEHSVVQDFRTDISDADCEEVEVLGWLYQFYISERKDEVMARRKAVPTEDIPAVTQLFTPHWIVRYLVENSLGRLWKNSRPNTRLQDHMPYYVPDPEDQPSVASLTVERPEEIKVMDPACGSGHMLTYAFDLLYHIYEEEGHAPSEIPALILTHNLHGLEICPRATQLAQFALICKAREKSRSAFRRPAQPQVMCLEDVEITTEEMTSYLKVPGMRGLLTEDALKQIHQFKDTDTFGSLIQPILSEKEIQNLRSELESKKSDIEKGDLLVASTHRKVQFALDQAEMLSQRYQVVVANPPYMGSKGMNGQLSKWAKDNYTDSKADLFAMFIERGLEMVTQLGYSAMVTMQSWMFLSSYEKLRTKLMIHAPINCMAHMSNMVMGIAFGTTATIWIRGGDVDQQGAFCFVEYEDIGDKNRPTSFPPRNQRNKSVTNQVNSERFFRLSMSDFKKIPGGPIAYWIGEVLRDVFVKSASLDSIAEVKHGLSTGKNELLVRFWAEVSSDDFGVGFSSRTQALDSGLKWFPYNKGGAYRKWFGNSEYVLRYDKYGNELMASLSGHRHDGKSHYFRPGITWTFISSSKFAARYSQKGFVFDVSGSSLFVETPQIILAFLCTDLCFYILKTLNPTLNFQVGNLKTLPILSEKIATHQDEIREISDKAIDIAQTDWDFFETSWDFRNHPILNSNFNKRKIRRAYDELRKHWKDITKELHNLEKENNKIFSNVYGVMEELTSQNPLSEITLTCNPHYRYSEKKSSDELETLLLAETMKEFLSYVVGCMMGRYSLNKQGLILADAGDTLENYLAKVELSRDQLTFSPDEDAIIPILSGEWFEDDIVGRTREFLRVTFGEDTLEENIQFIEDALGKDLRKYFLTDFYKDHLQTYKKRPIYWLFQSPKKGFNALIYMHRYNRDTVNNILNRYLREYLSKLRSHLEHLDHVIASESTSARDKTRAQKESDQTQKTLRECEDWERDTLLPLAQQRIEIDLDDGVKANYPKFGKALAKVAGLST